MQPPAGKSGKPNSWKKIPGTGDRPNKYVPNEPVSSPKGGQPGASWDPEGNHWDVDNGQGSRQRYAPDGTEVGHDGNPVNQPGQTPAPSTDQVKMVGGAAILYWIISEGSRIAFPPRNLVPVP